THYAVALRYNAKEASAPRVVAKGRGHVAARIRELARAAGVPVLSQPPLARLLHKVVPEGREIPANLYQAVAEVLAYVYRLRNRRRAKMATEAANRPLLGDAAGGLLVVGVLALAVVPLPAAALDLLLAASLCLSVLVFLVAVYVERPLEFSAFPSVLLLATLFRLSLNIASTRIILLHGGDGGHAAGKVIQAFGEFAVGGNFVVGAVVFLILVIVNFIVITKGADRISEVAARFTLDSMPGKQMAIDADLGAGLINEKEARERRRAIEHEAEFHGAMDGASKFVRGDAVAGLLIVGINIVGGIIIGVAQAGLSIGDAAHTCSILSIGDGVVSQIPALLISTGSALLVTRDSSGKALAPSLGAQLFSRPRPAGLAAAVLGGLALVPGMPHVAFLALAGATG